MIDEKEKKVEYSWIFVYIFLLRNNLVTSMAYKSQLHLQRRFTIRERYIFLVSHTSNLVNYTDKYNGESSFSREDKTEKKIGKP